MGQFKGVMQNINLAESSPGQINYEAYCDFLRGRPEEKPTTWSALPETTQKAWEYAATVVLSDWIK